LVSRGEVIKSNEFRRTRIRKSYSTRDPDLTKFSTTVYARTSQGPEEPYFLKSNSSYVNAGFSLACTITADLSNLRNSLKEYAGPDGPFWALNYEVGILFGTTELTAVILWKDPQGAEHRRTACVIPQRLT